MYVKFIPGILLFISLQVLGQKEEKTNYFLAYEFGEMAFNRFRNFAGEAGVKFKNSHMLRLVYMDVKLTEKHLSSGFANVVSGKNVEGHFKGYELFYDVPVFKGVHTGGSAGYYNDFYRHTLSGRPVNHTTPTLGFEVNYRETDLFKLKGVYFNLAVPFRFYLRPLEKTDLGGSTINRHFFENNIWMFIGYEF